MNNQIVMTAESVVVNGMTFELCDEQPDYNQALKDAGLLLELTPEELEEYENYYNTMETE
jgi:hypothetical protein